MASKSEALFDSILGYFVQKWTGHTLCLLVKVHPTGLLYVPIYMCYIKPVNLLNGGPECGII